MDASATIVLEKLLELLNKDWISLRDLFLFAGLPLTVAIYLYKWIPLNHGLNGAWQAILISDQQPRVVIKCRLFVQASKSANLDGMVVYDCEDAGPNNREIRYSGVDEFLEDQRVTIIDRYVRRRFEFRMIRKFTTPDVKNGVERGASTHLFPQYTWSCKLSGILVGKPRVEVKIERKDTSQVWVGSFFKIA